MHIQFGSPPLQRAPSNSSQSVSSVSYSPHSSFDEWSKSRPSGRSNDLESLVTNESFVSSVAQRIAQDVAKDVAKEIALQFNQNQELQKHIENIKQEKLEASGLDEFNVDQYMEFTESPQFMRSLDFKLSSMAPNLKKIR